MKANFNNTDTDDNVTRAFTGNFEDMLKERKRALPALQHEVQSVLDEWSGEMICIVKVHEDENGDPTGRLVFMGGVTKLNSQLSMAKALARTIDDIQEKILDTVKNNPAQAGAILTDMIEFIKDDLKNKEK